MPAVFAFLVALALVAFLIAFGGNKALEALGINVDVPGGYVTSTLIIMMLLYLPVVIVTAIQETKARREDPDSLLAQDTRTLNELARRHNRAVPNTDRRGMPLYREADQSANDWPLLAIQERLDCDASELQPTSPMSWSAVQDFLDQIKCQQLSRPIEALAVATPPELKKAVATASSRCLLEFDQLHLRALRGTLTHFEGQAPEASRDYRAQRVADVFRIELGIPLETGSDGRSPAWEGDDLVLSGQLRALATRAESNSDPSALAQGMLSIAVLSGAWVASPQRATLT
jgi:hypothetical protein